MNAIPGLLNVIVLLMFVFFLWGVLGMQLWMGRSHQRCRLTDFPVAMSPVELAADGPYWAAMDFYAGGPEGKSFATVDEGEGASDPLGLENYCNASAYFAALAFDRTRYPQCSDVSGVPVEIDNAEWQINSQSPWETPRQCVWPIDTSDTRLCTTGAGYHSCVPFTYDAAACAGLRGTVQLSSVLLASSTSNATCASNFDRFGSPRFVDNRFMASDIFIVQLSFGRPQFDNMYNAFVAFMQALTQAGWSDCLYMVRAFSSDTKRVSPPTLRTQFGDMDNVPISLVYWCSLVLIGSFFMVNLTLAVLYNEFSRSQVRPSSRPPSPCMRRHARSDLCYKYILYFVFGV